MNEILGLNFNDFNGKDEFLKKVLAEYHFAKETDQTKSLSYLNTHCVNIAYENNEFKEALNESDISFLDGIGLKIICNKILGTNINFALTPPEWMHDFFTMLPKGTKIYFIGDEPQIIEQYNKLFCDTFPDLRSVGYHHGFFLKDPEAENFILRSLKHERPDIVIIGMGMPIQELWIQKLRKELQVPLLIPVGAFYQRVLGIQSRPPKLIADMGMEWFYRFLTDPRRLFKRYIIGNPLFIYRILKYKFSLTKVKPL